MRSPIPDPSSHNSERACTRPLGRASEQGEVAKPFWLLGPPTRPCHRCRSHAGLACWDGREPRRLVWPVYDLLRGCRSLNGKVNLKEKNQQGRFVWCQIACVNCVFEAFFMCMPACLSKCPTNMLRKVPRWLPNAPVMYRASSVRHLAHCSLPRSIP